MRRRRTADDVLTNTDTLASLTAARAALQAERAALVAERKAATAAAEAAADAAAALAAVVARCEKVGVARRPDGEAALRELCGVQPRPARRRVNAPRDSAPVVALIDPLPPAPVPNHRWLACFGG